MLIDTHCHLDPTHCPEGADKVLERAHAVGVGGVVVVGVGQTLMQAEASVELARRYPHTVAATVGVHPHDAHTLTAPLLDQLRTLAVQKEVVALGETGLDYAYDHSPRKIQHEAFAQQIALARLLQKPLVVHTRQAGSDTLALLRSEKANEIGGVIHCFSEDKAFAKEVLDLGFFLSFSGIVTFKGAHALQEVAAWAPLEQLLVETDSPYLAPVPLRGKPCEPAYVVHTATHLAKLKGLSFGVLAEATTQNAQRCFHRSFSPHLAQA